MVINNFLTKLFRKKKLTPEELAKKTIRKMGYKNEGNGTFAKESSNGQTMIWFMNNGIKIKVYSGGYGESDFLPGPVSDINKLKQFIRENEL